MKIYIKTPARLHMGLIDLSGSHGRIYGGLGVGLNYPNVIIEVWANRGLHVESESGTYRAAIISLVRRFASAFNVPDNVYVRVVDTIPVHVGLGSGTQLALAIATALAKIYYVKASVQELAVAMGRGKRTCVGTTVFESGGFVVDCGRSLKKDVSLVEGFPKPIFKYPFPSDWPFVVAIPNAVKGFSGVVEEKAFENLYTVSEEKIDRVCRLIIMKLIPALMEHNVWEFGEALTAIQSLVGSQFTSVQGGIFSNALAAEGISLLQKLGACGVGQSSWGPTFYGLFANVEKAEKARAETQRFLEKHGCGGRVFVTYANNKGAIVRLIRKRNDKEAIA